MKTLIFAFFLGVAISTAQAAVTVLDSFTEGPFNLSIEGVESSSSPVSSPFGETRRGRINPRRAIAGGTATSTLDDSLGTLTFNVDALPSGPGAIDLRLSYTGGGPHSLLGFSTLEFDFSAISGTGSLMVSLDYAEAVYGPSLFRLPLNSTGTTAFDVSDIILGSGASLGDFDSMQIIFEADTEQFAFTLSEIRAIPEPSAILLTPSFFLSILLRRRRIQQDIRRRRATDGAALFPGLSGSSQPAP